MKDRKKSENRTKTKRREDKKVNNVRKRKKQDEKIIFKKLNKGKK